MLRHSSIIALFRMILAATGMHKVLVVLMMKLQLTSLAKSTYSTIIPLFFKMSFLLYFFVIMGRGSFCYALLLSQRLKVIFSLKNISISKFKRFLIFLRCDFPWKNYKRRLFGFKVAKRYGLKCLIVFESLIPFVSDHVKVGVLSSNVINLMVPTCLERTFSTVNIQQMNFSKRPHRKLTVSSTL